MTKSSSKYIIPVMTAALAAVMYWFWAFPYRAVLSYREQLQLFQTTASYFRETVDSLHGFLNYISEFLIQFFNNYWLGAAVMTILPIAAMLLCLHILRRIAPKLPVLLAFALSVIPLLFIWLYLGDPNTTLILPVGVFLALALIGLIVNVVQPRGKSAKAQPDKKNMMGVLRNVPNLIAIILIAAEIAGGIFLYPLAYNRETYKIINYDYLVRANDWEGVLEYADSDAPDLPLSVSATNLALGMTGQLDSRAFDYFQKGPEGLVPSFQKETLSSWTTGEIFFQLGMVNSAQRFYFEGMEAIPDYRKSSRAIRRLAETAIIRGEYTIAEKYLHILENTLFYRKWARRNLGLIKDDKAVAQHPLYGRLRASMVDDDYMFSEGELDKTFGQLYLKNPDNNLAKQSLVVYPLLQRDLNKFSQYMGVVAEKDSRYNPLLAQQAAAFMAMKNGQPIPQGLVSPAVEQQLRSFAQAWTTRNPDLIAPHRHTLFHYLLSSQ